MAPDSSGKMKFNIRFQSLLNTQRSLEDGESWESSFLIRRARMKFSGWVHNPKIAYKIELALSNRDLGSKHDFGETNQAPKIILDAVLKWNAIKHWTVWMGQTKLPGNRERVVSSANLQMVDRSLVNSVFNIDREMGFQLRGKYNVGAGVVKPILSWSLGEGRNVTQKNIGGFHYVARMEWLPMGEFASKGDYSGADLKREQTPKLALGGAYSLNNGASRQKQSGRFLQDADGAYLQNDLETVFGDLMFKYKGFSVMAEYAWKRIANNEVRDREDMRLNILDADGRSYYTGDGYNIQTGYLLPKDYEVSARYTSVTPNSEASFNGLKEYTVGLSKYVVGHSLKLQTDLSLLDEADVAANDLRYRFQVEFQF